jgi:phosphatidylglycerophosphatase A
MIKRKFEESQSKRGGTMKIKGPLDLLAVFIATGFGSGLIPFGPGTWGSLVGLLIAYGLISAFSLVLAAIGIWSSSRAESIFARKDAGQIVIDEVCGQVISFVFIAPYIVRLGSQWRWWMILGFLLFRAFDIFKPYPINRLQSLTGGVGVMMDDILAGIYAAVLMSLALMLFAS